MARLFDEVMDVLDAPWWVEKDETVRKVIYTYARDPGVVREVLEGKTTFAAEVRPLVQENLRLKMPLNNAACNSLWFVDFAEAKKKRLKSVFAFRWYFNGKELGMYVDLTTRFVLPKLRIALFTLIPFALVAGLHVRLHSLTRDGVIVSILAALAGFAFAFAPVYEQMMRRKIYADILKDQAAELDRIVGEYCQK